MKKKVIDLIFKVLHYRNSSAVNATQKYDYTFLCSLIKDVPNPSETGVQVLSKLFQVRLNIQDCFCRKLVFTLRSFQVAQL